MTNEELIALSDFQTSSDMDRYFKLKRIKEKVDKAKEIICLGLRAIETNGKCNHLFVEQAEQFLKEIDE